MDSMRGSMPAGASGGVGWKAPTDAEWLLVRNGNSHLDALCPRGMTVKHVSSFAVARWRKKMGLWAETFLPSAGCAFTNSSEAVPAAE